MTETQNYELRRNEVVFCVICRRTFLIIISDYNKYHFKISKKKLSSTFLECIN